jgi:catechol 2,3-dioxygenase-like lactoylglutathione lyase family enzyme
MPRLKHVLETCLYADDLDGMERFYVDVLGLRLVSRMGGVGVALRVSPRNVLLVFDRRESAMPGRHVPSHGTQGPGHVAFEIDPEQLDAWREHLTARGLAIEQEMTWPSGACSLYVRDPAGNSVEFMAGDDWAR